MRIGYPDTARHSRFPRLLFIAVAMVVMAWGLEQEWRCHADASKTGYENLEPQVGVSFLSFEVKLPDYGPRFRRSARERMRHAVDVHRAMQFVPYVWGGKTVASQNECEKCRSCIETQRLPMSASDDRRQACTACRSCGIDCSNFVNRLFEKSELPYRYATTQDLVEQGEKALPEAYGLIDLGVSLRQAKFGDLILQSGHVVLVTDVDMARHTISYIHSGHGMSGDDVGGIREILDVPMDELQKKVIRLLRHVEFFDDLSTVAEGFVAAPQGIGNDLG